MASYPYAIGRKRVPLPLVTGIKAVYIEQSAASKAFGNWLVASEVNQLANHSTDPLIVETADDMCAQEFHAGFLVPEVFFCREETRHREPRFLASQ